MEAGAADRLGDGIWLRHTNGVKVTEELGRDPPRVAAIATKGEPSANERAETKGALSTVETQRTAEERKERLRTHQDEAVTPAPPNLRLISSAKRALASLDCP